MTRQPFGPFLIHPHFIFHQSLLSCAFVNLRPIVPGHVLVIPSKNHSTRLHQLSDEETSDLFHCVRETQEIVESFYNASSSNIAIQDGREAGQSVPHVHVHILPRLGDDGWGDELYEELEEWSPRGRVKKEKRPWMGGEEREDRSHVEMETEASAYREFVRRGMSG